MSRFNKKILGALGVFILITAVILLIFTYQYSPNDYTCEDCNIILISVDTLRADHLSSYGYNRDTSSNIDKLAERSTVFKKTFAQSSHTTPSHFSMFTSLYPSQHENDGDSEEFQMLAEALNEEGYYTFSFNGGGNVRGELGFDRGFDEYKSANYSDFENVFKNASLFVDKTLSRHSGEKFFLFYHTYQVHDPYLPPEKYSKEFEPTYDDFRQESVQKWMNLTSRLERKGELSKKEKKLLFQNYRDYYFSNLEENKSLVEHAISEYDGTIKYTDDFLGHLSKKLMEKGLMDDTIVIITSDHGEQFGEHDKWLHYELYNEVIHVPLIIYVPGRNQRGEVRQYTESIDIAPTVLDVLGINKTRLQEQSEGDSLVPLMKGESLEKDYILSEVDDLNSFIDVDSGLKYYEDPSRGTKSLYNLKKDFQESNNISSSEKMSEMKSKLDEFEKRIGKETNDSEEVEKRLRDLGYVQ